MSEIVEILIFLDHRGDNALKSKTGKVGKYEEGALGGAWWVWQNASHLPPAWLRNT